MSKASRLRERARFERVHGVKVGPDVCIHRMRQSWFQPASAGPVTVGEHFAYAFGSLAAFAYLAMQDLKRELTKK